MQTVAAGLESNFSTRLISLNENISSFELTGRDQSTRLTQQSGFAKQVEGDLSNSISWLISSETLTIDNLNFTLTTEISTAMNAESLHRVLDEILSDRIISSAQNIMLLNESVVSVVNNFTTSLNSLNNSVTVETSRAIKMESSLSIRLIANYLAVAQINLTISAGTSFLTDISTGTDQSHSVISTQASNQATLYSSALDSMTLELTAVNSTALSLQQVQVDLSATMVELLEISGTARANAAVEQANRTALNLAIQAIIQTVEMSKSLFNEPSAILSSLSESLSLAFLADEGNLSIIDASIDFEASRALLIEASLSEQIDSHLQSFNDSLSLVNTKLSAAQLATTELLQSLIVSDSTAFLTTDANLAALTLTINNNITRFRDALSGEVSQESGSRQLKADLLNNLNQTVQFRNLQLLEDERLLNLTVQQLSASFVSSTKEASTSFNDVQSMLSETSVRLSMSGAEFQSIVNVEQSVLVGASSRLNILKDDVNQTNSLVDDTTSTALSALSIIFSPWLSKQVKVGEQITSEMLRSNTSILLLSSNVSNLTQIIKNVFVNVAQEASRATKVESALSVSVSMQHGTFNTAMDFYNSTFDEKNSR